MEIAIVKKLFLLAFLPLLLLAACSDNTTQPPTGDTEKPTVAFVKPVNDQELSEGPLDVELTASDNVGVVKIELYVNTATSPAVTLQAAPWKTALDVSALIPGTHTIRAKAYDAAGNASNFVAVTVVRIVPGVFGFSFRAGATFAYNVWNLDESNQKTGSPITVNSIVEQGSGQPLGGRSDWWRIIDTDPAGTKDTLTARIDGNGNLEVYGFASDFIRRFVQGMNDGGFPIEVPVLPDPEWKVLGYFNSAPGAPANPGSEWDITSANGIDIPVGLFSANVKIKGKFVDRTETVTINGKTISLWHVELSNIISILGSESIIKVHIWYSDDPSGRILLWQESTLLNLLITNYQLNGERWELKAWQ
jgi:hypothetical protein